MIRSIIAIFFCLVGFFSLQAFAASLPKEEASKPIKKLDPIKLCPVFVDEKYQEVSQKLIEQGAINPVEVGYRIIEGGSGLSLKSIERSLVGAIAFNYTLIKASLNSHSNDLERLKVAACKAGANVIVSHQEDTGFLAPKIYTYTFWRYTDENLKVFQEELLKKYRKNAGKK